MEFLVSVAGAHAREKCKCNDGYRRIYNVDVNLLQASKFKKSHVLALKLFCVRIIDHSLIVGGRKELICATRSGTPGTSIMTLMLTTLPAAWTPASVRAARWRSLCGRRSADNAIGNRGSLNLPSKGHPSLHQRWRLP